MRTSFGAALSAIALISIVSVGNVFAADTSTTSPSHEEHHSGANTPTATDTDSMGGHGGMMDKMDMGKMQGMMKECMSMHKDGKMCDHDMMNKCQEKMGKGDCHKMMKQVKKEEKSKK